MIRSEPPAATNDLSSYLHVSWCATRFVNVPICSARLAILVGCPVSFWECAFNKMFYVCLWFSCWLRSVPFHSHVCAFSFHRTPVIVGISFNIYEFLPCMTLSKSIKPQLSHECLRSGCTNTYLVILSYKRINLVHIQCASRLTCWCALIRYRMYVSLA